MKKLKLKEGVDGWAEGTIRADYETESDEQLVKAFAKRGYELSLGDAYHVWLALSMSWDASWLNWMGDTDQIMEEVWQFVEVVE